MNLGDIIATKGISSVDRNESPLVLKIFLKTSFFTLISFFHVHVTLLLIIPETQEYLFLLRKKKALLRYNLHTIKYPWMLLS